MRAFDVAGIKVNVANVGGRLYAIDDSCAHAGCSLAKGTLDGTTVICGCHGSRFDVTSGRVLHGPATRSIRAHDVHVDGDALLIGA
jgi:nitrite reductase/ring-hydroxylating ferredoxin subunit